MSLGWRGSAIHWVRYEKAYLLLAGLSTPLVLSVHTVVSFDFAVSVLPGWHATIFPPYFVAGAIYAGFAMVLTLAIPLRAMYKLHDYITIRHLENMAKITLITGLIVVYGYACEAFFGWYSGNEYERFMLKNRVYYGPYAWSYWALLICNFIVPQMLWSKRLRRNLVALFTVAMFVNVGMWLERFVIIVTSLHRDFIPGSWDMYYPTIWDFMTLFGTIGLFTTLMFLFVRVLPMISIFEMRTLVPEAQVKHPPEGGAHSMAHATTEATPFYGLMAEFESAQALVDAAHKVRAAGYTRADAYSPFPIHGLAEALGFGERHVAPIVLGAGITGALAGYGLEYWTRVIAFPLNIGGRPLHSWVSFIPPAFETTILFAAFSAVIGMIALNGLPQPYHPVFNVDRFTMASSDKFFLVIEADDAHFAKEQTTSFLRDLGAKGVYDVAE
jgi:hypothetical protein